MEKNRLVTAEGTVITKTISMLQKGKPRSQFYEAEKRFNEKRQKVCVVLWTLVR